MTATPPMLLVLTPCFLPAGLSTPAGLRAMQAWRDGRLKPALDRELLVRYLRVWRGLGLPDLLLRRWTWWFTSPEKALYLPGAVEPPLPLARHCARLAARTTARYVVHGGCARPGGSPEAEDGGDSGPPWLTSGELLERLG